MGVTSELVPRIGRKVKVVLVSQAMFFGQVIMTTDSGLSLRVDKTSTLVETERTYGFDGMAIMIPWHNIRVIAEVPDDKQG